VLDHSYDTYRLGAALSQRLSSVAVRDDNGWVIKIGRGLDFYQRPPNWSVIGSNDLSQRKCVETKVDIYRIK